MFGLIGTLGGGLVNGLFKSGLARKQQRMADAIHPVNTTYEVNPYANKMLGLAQQSYNSRMPAAGRAERNVFASQGNAMASAQRNATDQSQILSLLGGIQAGTNDALSNLQSKEEQYRASQLGNLNNAYATMINEGDKVYKDKVRRYESDMQAKMALQGAAIQNKGSLFNDIASGLQTAGFQADQLIKGSDGGGSGRVNTSFSQVSAPQSQQAPTNPLGTIPPLQMQNNNQAEVYYDEQGRAYQFIQGRKVYI